MPALAPVEPRDEAPHEHGDEPGWSERLQFCFFDDASGFAGVVRVEFRPAEGSAEGSVNVFVPDGALATVLTREKTPGGGFSVGRIKLDPYAALEKWRIRCADTALVFPNTSAAGLPPVGQRTGAAAPLQLDVTFGAWMEPRGGVERRTEVDEQRFARTTSSGHFEQAGGMSGGVSVGGRRAEIAGHGVRDKTWGGRGDPMGAHASRWFAMPFGPDLAIAVRAVSLGERRWQTGWVSRDGEMRAVRSFHLETEHEGRARARVTLVITDEAGDRYDLTGRTLQTIPWREHGARVERSLTRFRLDDRETLGIAEYAGD